MAERNGEPTPTVTFHQDGWSAGTRVGVVVPHADVGPEAEFQAMAPSDKITIHASRLHFGAMRAGGVMDPKIPHQPVRSFTDPPHVDDAVAELAQSPLDVIGLGFTSSAYKLGPAGEQALIERLGERARGIPLISTCQAATNALLALGAGSLALINPPWFDDELDSQGADYFSAQGIDVVHHAPAGLPSNQTDIKPKLLFDWVRSVAPGSDAVFIAGNGQRAVGIIDALEAELGIPVLTANQVLLWQCLRTAKAEILIEDYGRVLQLTS